MFSVFFCIFHAACCNVKLMFEGSEMKCIGRTAGPHHFIGADKLRSFYTAMNLASRSSAASEACENGPTDVWSADRRALRHILVGCSS